MTCLPPKSTGSQESSRFNIQLLGALPLIGSTQQPFLCAFLKKKKKSVSLQEELCSVTSIRQHTQLKMRMFSYQLLPEI